MRHAPAATRPGALVEEATALLAAPALVVVAGGPGSGRSTVLTQLGAAFRGPVFAGGGLAMLQAVPAFALTRAVRVRLPAADPALLAEAVRSRVRGGLLLLDDLQWADPATLSALPAVAAHCRVVVALRTPHRLPPGAVQALRAAAAGWLAVPPLSAQDAADLARRVAPGLDQAGITAVVDRAGGVPLAVETLARHAASRGTADMAEDAAQVEYAVAAALADLTRPARTAMAALGLLGRPATAAVLGAGVEELAEAGLVTSGGGELTPVSPYLAEVAAGLLDPPGRQALHRRLASLVPPREAARHLAAAGDAPAAYQVAVAAAGRMGTAGERAELLLLACDLPGVDPDPDVRVAAASAALACGRPRAAVRTLTVTGGPPLGVDAAVLRAEALLQVGEVAAARDAAAPVPDGAARDVVAARDRVLLLAQLAEDPAEATAAAARIAQRHGDPPPHAGLRAALAAVRAHARADGWEYGLASATAAAGTAGDLLAARWSAWLLVETLAADGRLAEAAQAAGSAAQACAADLAYSWQTRFLAAELWCVALRGAATDDVVRRAGDLVDRTLPALARGYATAAASLVEADGGLLAPARSRLAGVAAPSALLDWVGREAAWLDGQPDVALRPAHADLARAGALVAGLHEITARWASSDLGLTGFGPRSAATGPDGGGPPVGSERSEPAGTGLGLTGFGPRSAATGPDGGGPPVGSERSEPAGTDLGLAPPAGKAAVDRATAVAATLAAWTAAGGFDRAAAAWHDLAVREEVRCLLAQGIHESDPALAVPPLLAAERLAEQAGLVVLLGRARRALRRHAVRRDQRGPRAGTDLTDRERDVLRLVAAGEPTRRIAGQLGISGETVETHIRSGMRKLGARTRTEAAARLGQLT